MASKRHQRRRSCEHKKVHETVASALQAVTKLKRRGEDVHYYTCENCGKIHVGHRGKPQWLRREEMNG